MSEEHDDLLRRAARSLQEETEGPSSAARFTRLRVMASLRETQVKRRTQTVLLLPFAACLAATAAWGMAAGVVPDIRESITRALGIAPPAQPAPAPRAKPAPRKAPAERAPEAPTPLENVTPAPAPAPVEEPAPEASVRPAPAKVLKLDPKKHSRLAAADPAHELYRAAHEAHFVAHDCERALAGWDAYLRAAPRGGLAVEARYNRALCLVRLGRSDEARRALEPFARGAAGSYRQREASGLLEVLGEN